MFESFDYFSSEHDREKSDQERLVKEAGNQWELLSNLAIRFANEGKSFDGHSFSWAEGLNSLILGAVAARFSKRGRILNDSGRGFNVTFCRAPSPGVPLEESAIPDETLILELQCKDGEFAWLAKNYEGTLSPEVLLEEIARRLSKYHLKYKKASGF